MRYQKNCHQLMATQWLCINNPSTAFLFLKLCHLPLGIDPMSDPKATLTAPASIQTTFHGHIECYRDALMVIDAARRDLLPRVKHRLTESDKKTIGSGSVFVLNEHECGVRRWTDGRLWSPSRIAGMSPSNG
jgi:hypothetical protein